MLLKLRNFIKHKQVSLVFLERVMAQEEFQSIKRDLNLRVKAEIRKIKEIVMQQWDILNK